jgi:hypothetical protein
MSQSYHGDRHRERGDCGFLIHAEPIPNLDAIPNGDGKLIIHDPDNEQHWIQSDTTAEVKQ